GHALLLPHRWDQSAQASAPFEWIGWIIVLLVGALLLKASQEVFHDDSIELIAKIFVFYTGINVGIVVDLDDIGFSVLFFEVDPIEPIANVFGGGQCRGQNSLGHLIGGKGFKAAAHSFAGAVVVDLPMVLRHVVTAGK